MSFNENFLIAASHLHVEFSRDQVGFFDKEPNFWCKGDMHPKMASW